MLASSVARLAARSSDLVVVPHNGILDNVCVFMVALDSTASDELAVYGTRGPHCQTLLDLEIRAGSRADDVVGRSAGILLL